MSKKLTKSAKEYQYSKKYTFEQLELALAHSLKVIKARDEEIEELKQEVERYNKIFKDQRQ